MSVEIDQKEFKDIQAEYNQLYEKEPIRDEDRAYAWFANRLIQYQPSVKSVLDIACGGGYFLKHIRHVVQGKVSLTGVDISERALEIARKECPEASYLHSVAEKLPFGDAIFDSVTCLGSLEHFLDIGEAIREMKRVAKRDALFLILVPNIFWYKDILSVLLKGDRFARNQTHEKFASWGEWKQILEDHGLKVMKTEKYNGIARQSWKQQIKDWLIPTRFSYHFCFFCNKQA
ncbi:MAG: class I SAM-dependent methyltransferase [Candidatus Omnitrophica bacterium]|nr:class I SAM-dependent methyltransferase [Candidatus Omnitrophota bacterium]